MKNKKIEMLRKRQHDFYRRYHPLAHKCQIWMTGTNDSTECDPADTATYGVDFGFVLGGRLVEVWWEHPKMIYGAAVAKLARERVGNPVSPMRWLLDSLMARSRGLLRKYRNKPTRTDLPLIVPDWLEQYQQAACEIGEKGILLEIVPSIKIRRTPHSTKVTLVAPLNIRGESDHSRLEQLTDRLLRGLTTLRDEFPGYAYGPGDWRAEHNDMHL